MNKAIKVLLINLAVAFGLTMLLFLGSGGASYKANDFLIGLGLISLAGTVLDLLLAVIFFISGPAQRDLGKGFLLSAGVLLLIGFAACGSATINFH
jgi:hypothetical protein